MKNFINNKYALILVFICLVVIGANYEPGTILSGWDTLHPEFNFAEYFRKIIFGVWQRHQGLGSLATQAHPAELPRLIIYYLMSFVTPISFLRYSYFFLTLILGPLGVFFFVKEIIFPNKPKKGQIFAFCGGLFYLLNLVTVQQYFVPFEMFATHYASLGWIFLLTFKYLGTGIKKYLIYFTLLNLLISSIAHTATLWYSYFFSFLIFLIVLNFIYKKRAFFKKSLLLAVSGLAVNLFWILSNIYFAINLGDAVGKSKIHSLFTQEAFVQNVSFGTIQDYPLFKNFLFNWGSYKGHDLFGPLLETWSLHLENPLVFFLGYAFFTVIILGIIFSIKNKNRLHLSFLSIFLLSTFFWFTTNPPLGFIFSFLQDHIPLFKEAFRFPFTKFSILLVFSASIYFALGLDFLDSLSQKIKRNQIFTQILLLSVIFALIYYSFPAFKGNLISPSMRVQIPQEYFQLFNWFNKQEDGRVATLPIHSFWGWTYYKWGYQGAGFLWFGIKQPLLDREFDRWNPYNEQYFREMSQAVYSEDENLFKQVIKKYDIKYVLVDKNVISPGPGSNPKVLFFDEIDKLLQNEPDVIKISRFGNVYVYTLSSKTGKKGLSLIKNPVSVSPPANAYYKDFAYLEFGNYITKTNNNQLRFPFKDIIDNQNRLTLKTDTQNSGLNTSFSTNSKALVFPEFEQEENQIAADIYAQKEQGSLNLNFYPLSPFENIQSAPISLKTSLPSGNFILNITGKNSYLIGQLMEKTPFYLGRTFLNTEDKDLISIYNPVPYKIISPDFSASSYAPYSCGALQNNSNFGLSVLDKTSFSIFGKNSQTCLIMPLTKLIPQIKTELSDSKNKTLLSVIYNYEGPSEANLCIADIRNGNCFQFFSKNLALTLPGFQYPDKYFTLDKSKLDNLALKIFLDSRSSETVQTANYSNFSFGFVKPLFSADIPKVTIRDSFAQTQLGKTDHYVINIPFSGDEELSQDITKLPKTAGDCPSLNPRGPIASGKNIFKEESNQYIRYSSEEGSFCDHFSYQNLPHNQAYLVSIVSRNVSGLPLRLCITNSFSKRCDLYTELTESKDFKEEKLLLTSLDTNVGYDINLNNFAVKKIPSVNDLKSITIIPFPYEWLSQITLGDLNRTKVPGLKKPLEATYVNPSLYIVNIPSGIQKSDTIMLSQAYEGGWHAYSFNVDDQKSKIKLFLNGVFPFVFGRELKDHVLVNNWENGWELDGSSGNSTIVIIYLPQYLEYLGFILLIATFILIFKLPSQH